jgi:hypothetical protein
MVLLSSVRILSVIDCNGQGRKLIHMEIKKPDEPIPEHDKSVDTHTPTLDTQRRRSNPSKTPVGIRAAYIGSIIGGIVTVVCTITTGVIAYNTSKAQVTVNNFNSNVTTNITEIRKEITGVKEAITELYKRTKTEVIRCTASNKLSYVHKDDGANIALLRLDHVPIPESVTATSFTGVQAVDKQSILPPWMELVDNIVCVTWGTGVDYTNFSYCITYVIDPNRSNVVGKIDFVNGVLVLDGLPRLRFP